MPNSVFLIVNNSLGYVEWTCSFYVLIRPCSNTMAEILQYILYVSFSANYGFSGQSDKTLNLNFAGNVIFVNVAYILPLSSYLDSLQLTSRSTNTIHVTVEVRTLVLFIP
jgi:glycopeptide antibiotics resistance protein